MTTMTIERIDPTDIDSPWMRISNGACMAEAKIYDTGSQFGISGGRVSKLFLRRDGGTPIYNYDRGLDFDKMTEAERAFYSDILEIFDGLRPAPERGWAWFVRKWRTVVVVLAGFAQ